MVIANTGLWSGIFQVPIIDPVYTNKPTIFLRIDASRREIAYFDN